MTAYRIASPTPHTYRVQFRPGAPNHCPGCSHSQWFVGRFSAECAMCGTAIEIAGMMRGAGVRRRAA